MDNKQKGQSKAKVLKASLFFRANHPYFIQKLDMTLDPLNTMDCIRIYDKNQELQKEPDNSPAIWSPIHYCWINPKDMTVVMDTKPD